MARSIAPGVYWIQECNTKNTFSDDPSGDLPDWGEPNSEVHATINAFLIVDEKTLLFDTLSRAAEDLILDELDSILGDQQLDYIVPSHPETPHAGNTLSIQQAYPEATILAPEHGSTHDLYYLESAEGVSDGDVIDLGQHTFEIQRAVFLDHGMSIWGYEQSEDILFTVDWMGFPHLSNDCYQFVDELKNELTTSQLRAFHGRVFSWCEYADSEKVEEVIEYLSSKFGSSMIAPAHGLVIREDADTYLQMMTEVIKGIRDEGRINKSSGVVW